MNKSEWLAWRHAGIGSSDAPIIMGVSPYKSRIELWREKSGPVLEERSSFITDKGHRKETIARQKLSAILGLQGVEDSLEPHNVTSVDYSYLRASLDGYAKDKSFFVEFKFQGKADFALNLVPEKYYPQLQHQLLLTGCKYAYFCGINEEDEIKYFEVEPDPKYIQRLLAEEIIFWDCVLTGKEPESGPNDFFFIPKGEKLAKKYFRIDERLKKLETEKEKTKERILKLCLYEKNLMHNLKVQSISKIGNVNYKSIPELKDVDLEKYRGKSSTYWKFSK